MFVLKTYRRFLQFLRKPDQTSFPPLEPGFKVKTLLSLLLLNVLFSFLWLMGYTLITGKPWVNPTLNVEFVHFWMFLITIVVLVPALEEFLFRLPLKYERNYLLQFILLIIGTFYDRDEAEEMDKNVQETWSRFFRLLVYLSSSIFAFIHIFNYPDFDKLLLWFPLLTMVQFLLGLILSFIRIRFGFFWGLLYHSMYNLVVFGAVILLLGIRPCTNGEAVLTLPTIQEQPADWLISQAGADMDFEIGNRAFKEYHVDNDTFSLTIQRDREVKGFPGFGVTPSRIFFDWTNAQHVLRTLSNENVTVNDPDSMRLFVELKVKKPRQTANFSRNILERELFKALDLK